MSRTDQNVKFYLTLVFMEDEKSSDYTAMVSSVPGMRVRRGNKTGGRKTFG